jgi:hypothetical protein
MHTTTFRRRYYTNSNSECHSPDSSPDKSISLTPLQKHSCSPNTFNIKPPKIYGPSFEFCKFSHFVGIPLSVIKKKLDIDQLNEIKKRITYNNNVSKLKPNEKSKLAKELAKKHNSRGEITRIAKSGILKKRKESFEENLNLKFHKFEWKMKADEIQNIKKSWVLLYCLLGICYIAPILIKNKLRLKKRIIKKINWLKSISKCIGKLILKIKKIKKNKSMKIITLKLLPYLKKWIANKRSKYSDRIISFLNALLSASKLFNMVLIWNQKFRYLQNRLKHYLKIKKSIYEQLIFKWNLAEHSKLLKHNKFKLKNNQRLFTLASMKQKSKSEGVTVIPIKIKEIYIRKFIKRKFRSINSQFKYYYQVCAEIDKQNVANRIQIENLRENKLPYPDKPKIPRILDFFTEEEMVDLINVAQRDRLEWDNIIKKEKISH